MELRFLNSCYVTKSTTDENVYKKCLRVKTTFNDIVIYKRYVYAMLYAHLKSFAFVILYPFNMSTLNSNIFI